MDESIDRIKGKERKQRTQQADETSQQRSISKPLLEARLALSISLTHTPSPLHCLRNVLAVYVRICMHVSVYSPSSFRYQNRPEYGGAQHRGSN